MAITTEKELGEALKRNEDTIEIEGDLKNKVVRIKATGKIAWGVAAASLVVAIVAILAAPATGGTSTPVCLFVAPTAAGILGIPTATAAIWIAVVAGGFAALTKLRKYKIIEKSANRLVLKK